MTPEYSTTLIYYYRTASQHAAYCYRRSSVDCLCVCLYVVTFVSPTKTAEPIEMRFGRLTVVDPRNHVLDRGQDPHRKGQFWG